MPLQKITETEQGQMAFPAAIFVLVRNESQLVKNLFEYYGNAITTVLGVV